MWDRRGHYTPSGVFAIVRDRTHTLRSAGESATGYPVDGGHPPAADVLVFRKPIMNTTGGAVKD